MAVRRLGGSASPETRPPFDRAHVFAELDRLVEEDVEKRRRADVDVRAKPCDHLHLELGLTDSSGKHRASNRPRAAFEHRTGRREVIGEGIVDEIALAHPGREERARHAKRVGAARRRLEDRTRGREHVRVVSDRAGCQTSERWRFGLHRHQLRLPDNGQRRQRAAVRHCLRIDSIEETRDGGGAHCGSQVVAESRKQLRLTCFRVACFEGVVVVGGHWSEQRTRLAAVA